MNAMSPTDTLELFSEAERPRWEVEYEAFCREQETMRRADKRPFLFYSFPGPAIASPRTR